MKVTVAAFQGVALYDQVEKNIQVIKETVGWAEKNAVDILCFPECFLQGYSWSKEFSQKVSIDLLSPNFDQILQDIFSDTTTVILGLIEKEGDQIYNTAVVIEKGKLMGKYRKCHIHNKESFFTAGKEYPLFEKKGVKYGINICFDSRFSDSGLALARQGVQVIFCPLNNSLPHLKAKDWKDKHLPFFIKKAQECNCWVVTSDVVEQSTTHTGYGCTSIIKPEGEVIKCLEHLIEGRLLHHISI